MKILQKKLRMPLRPSVKGAVPFFLATLSGGIFLSYQAYAMYELAQPNPKDAPKQLEIGQYVIAQHNAPLSPNMLANQRGAASGFATPGLPVLQPPVGTVLWDEITPAPTNSQLTNQSISTGLGRNK